MTNKEKTYWVHDTMMTDRYYRENHLNNGNGQYHRGKNNFNIKSLLNKSCAKISGIVGTGIHLYSTAINNNHFQDIYDDFANERYLSGILKAVVPFALPYAVSFYARKKAKKESEGRINELERKIEEMIK